MSAIVSHGQPFLIEFLNRAFGGGRTTLVSITTDPADPSGSTALMSLGASGVALDLVGTVTVNGSAIGGAATGISYAGQVLIEATGSGNDVTITAADDVFVNPTDRFQVTAGGSVIVTSTTTAQLSAGTTLTLRAGQVGAGTLNLLNDNGDANLNGSTSASVVSQNGGVTLSATGGNLNAVSQDGDAQIASAAGSNLVRCAADGSMLVLLDPTKTLAFFDGVGAARVTMATGTGKTVDNLITALQNLGLFKQS
jgi:hypothetical protein